MLRALQLTQVLLLFLLSTSVRARLDAGSDGFFALQERGHVSHLRERQAGGTTVNCYSCSIESCGASSCTPRRKRDFVPLGHAERPYKLWNNTSDELYSVSAEEYNATINLHVVDKRAFTVTKRWTKQRIAAYVPGQIRVVNGVVVPADTQFPSNSGFFNPSPSGKGDMGTVSYMMNFAGQGPFQLGTGGLHGCTMVVIVCNTAVYMTHLWEGYAFLSTDNLADTDGAAWQTRAMNAITGQGAQDVLNYNAAPVVWAPFNAQGSNTEAFIFSPTISGSYSPRYPQKTNTIVDLIRSNIPGVRIVEEFYQALNYRYDAATGMYVGPDAALVDASEQGIALFQYDGVGSWRVFLGEFFKSNADTT